MKMLTKFESKSSRAKGVAFHATRPWLLVSLHSSTIQLWDYRMGTLIDRFEDHEGPVRSVAFHPSQPIFASGGDDYTIKVWSLQTRKCMFTLSGHLDYVRTVFFHHELPWIISASDDQTIRIWNWQNRQEIACLTGHNHYVMCAQFHPSDDLIVSASLDQTVRVWDISGLRKKHSAPTSSARSFEDQLARQNAQQQDIFGNTDAIVKYVLEGHDRGVNWATFHPKLPLIVSGGDDRLIKLWRMSETKAWEVDTCRGHTNNVPCVLFHPTQDLIISVGEDKTIRTWDLNKRTPVKQFKRDNDRFWLTTAHPSMNLFASCHDSGVMVFKLDRERPAHAVSQNKMFFINGEKQVQYYDYDKASTSLPMLTLKKIGKSWSSIRTLSYNPAERSILVTMGEADASTYALILLPKDVTGAIEPTDVRQGEGNSATFIARNRFVAFTKSTQTLDVKDLTNNTTKSIKLDGVKDIVSAGPGTILLLKATSVVHYDVQQRKELAEILANNVKYVTWSNDGNYVALLSKHTITIASKSLELISSMHETIRVKSAAWDDTGVLLYSTLNHIKYTLLNGDNGIIKTLENTLYITRVQGKQVFCLNRAGNVENLTIDPTEYRFKKALVNKNFSEVLRIIKNSNLVGQSIIAYLEKKGYPEIALQFVQDPETRFELAIECGNLDVALAEAKTLNSKSSWEKLAKEALVQGNYATVELGLQRLKQFEKLSFLYLATGESAKLAKMEAIAEHLGDYSSLVQNTFYRNSVEKRVQVLMASGLHPLAYATAKANGLDELVEQIVEQTGIDEASIVLPELGAPITLPESRGVVGNWPLRESSLSFFEQALLGQVEDLNLNETEVETRQITNDFESEAIFDDEDLAGEDAWDLGDEDLDIEVEEEVVVEESLSAAAELNLWLRNSHSAAGHVAAGSFETAAQLLNRQVGVVNFEPLRKRFLEVYQANKLYVPGTPGLPSSQVFIRADFTETENKNVHPYIPGYENVEARLHEGFKQFRSNKLEEAIAIFRDIIYTITVSAVPSTEEEDKCKEILTVCREYILGLSIELARRALDPADIKRNLELAAYFTKAQLQPAHRVNALQVAMTQAFKNKNFASASYFAGEFLKVVSTGPRAEQAQKIKTKADQSPYDALDIEFNPFAEFEICPATFTPIFKDAPFVSEALTGAKYQPSEKGKIDFITGITAIGASASGLRVIA
ncbi:hypothetical protein BABINDRAFT_161634 [Babjeviella inositovora NRRL Y-12698]|uniref:Coatomer subunit alpha n=1 Tax=Babjeviella inositovora NRRL Y-12698 TaxID=984486 RepID=A0A1E3QQP8_9ASCO|nr:uncharacterized protein BABINDRAFT_161634 [Babjeviella inositovora NRRL Y-12698]ODQ79980.1 hypothetical protein BABINDRAFT_161634 [Babjeviella inositovora NRRL Y-12698]